MIAAPTIVITPAPFVQLSAAQDAAIARNIRSAAAAKHKANIVSEKRNSSRRRFHEYERRLQTYTEE